MHQLIHLVFFLAGFAALIFETLWFRQAGLALGNSVWSTTLVLSSFMGGLALGNALVLRFGGRLVRPIFSYAVLETLIAVSGLLIVVILPMTGAWLSPLFGLLLDSPAVLNLVRLAIAFIILMIPATAMGATLPVLVMAMSRRDDNYGRVLGRLYGVNTLGATAGVLVTELYLVRWLGTYGAAGTAALTGLTAVILALLVRKRLYGNSKTEPDVFGDKTPHDHGPVSQGGKRYLLAAFLAGAAMLGLEVLWFRFLLLFQPGTSLVFAVMLATVLGGIASGGIIGAWLYARHVSIHRHIRLIAGISALMVTLSYLIFPWVQSEWLPDYGSTGYQHGFTAAAIILMLPVSLASGVLFTAIGRALKAVTGDGTRTTAWLTLANTTGAMFGAMLAGFALLPALGIENSLFAMLAMFGFLALLVPGAGAGQPGRRFARGSLVISIFVVSTALFPFGQMKTAFLGDAITKRFPGADIVAAREGLTETAVYLEYRKYDQPYFYRLITNSYSMSTTNEQATRYMKLFVYLPVALGNHPENALLISYGVGNTAKALTATSGLKSIDVVDISRDIMELGKVVFAEPQQNPLNDARVKVHVEDGRFFLQVTDTKYDLITAEPPPPTVAGIVNLYTREYFELIHARLNAGGITSYWLPGHSLEADAAKAIIGAFCAVFEDCSLWSGAGLDWILLGSRDAPGGQGLQSFSQQWNDPVVADELRAIGVETPAQLGSLFMADSEDLKQLSADVQPVTDAFPYRILLPYTAGRGLPPLYAWLLDTDRAARRFADSAFIRRHWPAELMAATPPYFPLQRLINQKHLPGLGRDPHPMDTLRSVLAETPLESLPLWLMGSNYREQGLIEQVRTDPRYAQEYEWGMARRDIAERRFAEAMRRLDRLKENAGPAGRMQLDRLYDIAEDLNR